MEHLCRRCGEKLDIQRSRRTPLYCSTRCRVAACRARKVQIPSEMRERARWVTWKPVFRDGRSTKVPMQVDNSPASSTDSATWTRFSSVEHLPRRGFVLGDGIGCIDLDHCLVDGVPTEAAEKFLAALPKTYVEISPSGDGLHVWGKLPEAPGTVRSTVDGLRAETYSRGRYITVTGQRFREAPLRLAALPID